MGKYHRYLNALVLCGTLLAASPAVAQTAGTFKARLSTVPVDATMLPTVAGRGSIKAVLTGNKLRISGTFEGLRSAAIRASIHIGPQEGIRGSAAHDPEVTKDKAGAGTGS